MLCPEVVNFKEPPCVIESKKIEKDSCLKILKDFNFVHLVTVFLPDTLRVSETFGFGLTSCDYYKISSLNVGELVTETFLNNFIHCGNLNLLSINTRIDCDDCIVITNSGHLILHLNKLTFQTLGLEGKLSHFHWQTKEKYIVTIDLKSETLKRGKPLYNRIEKCLQKMKKFEVIVTWEPPKKEICPSSVAKYFCDLGYAVKLCKIRKDVDTLYSVKVPIIDDLENFDEEDSANFVEWLGMISLNCSLNVNEAYISTYETPIPCIPLGQVKIIQWRGFFNSKMVADFLCELEKTFDSTTKLWKAVYFQGFSDAPAVWGLKEHHYYTNGDNGGVIILNKEKYFMYLKKCSNQRYK